MGAENEKWNGILQMQFFFSYWNNFAVDGFIPLKYWSDRPYALY